MAYTVVPRLTLPTRPTTGPREQHLVTQNLDREPPGDVLGGPGGNYDVYKYSDPFTVVRRQPLVYAPRSTARPNFGLLPYIPDMAGMELAYRHQAYSESDMAATATRVVGGIFVMGLVVPAVAIGIGHWFGPSQLVYAAPILSTFLVIGLFMQRQARPRNLLLALVVPAVVLALVIAINNLFLYRLRGAVVCSAASFALVSWLGMRPFRFYLDWLYTHPRLRPETRRDLPTLPPPDYLLLLLALATAALVPTVSNTLAMALIAGMSVFRILRDRHSVRDLFAQGALVLTPFLTYGGPDAFAPGVWRASMRYITRSRSVLLLLGPLFVALAASLCLYMPLVDAGKLGILGSTPPAGMSGMAVPRPELRQLLWEAPYGWVVAMVREYNATGWSHYFFGVPVSIVVGTLLPPLLLVATFRAPIGAVFQARRRIEGTPERTGERPLDDDGRVEWQWYVDRLKDSPHECTGPLGETIREADHLFLGVEPHARFPVLLHEKLLSEHAYFTGDSGSGKTSLGLMPLLIQLIRGHGVSEQDARAGRVFTDGRTLPPPIVVIDLKGDPGLFHTVKKEAEERGLEFRFFTPEMGQASHLFNPFASLDSENRTEIQLCQIMLDALSLNHGEGYGRGYYSRQSRALLLAALTAPRKPRSIKELYEAIRELRDGGVQDYKDTLELLSTVHALTQYKVLALRSNPKRPEEAIHMPSVLERRQVVYFWLPAAVESVSAREIAKLALYSLLTACIDRQRSRPQEAPRQAYVVIDEFQRIAGENFRIILEQARSFGLGVVLSNQCIADLQTPDADLRPTVRTNTRVKRYFSVTDPREIADLSDASGQELAYMRGWMQTAGEAPYTEYVGMAYNSKTESQSLKPRLTPNDIMAASDHPLDSIVHISRGSGYTQFAGLPIVVRCTWPMSRADHERRSRSPWPTRKEYPNETTTCNDKSPIDYDRERDAETKLEAFAKLQSLNAQRT